MIVMAEEEESLSEFMTVEDIAQRLQLSTDAVTRALRLGILPGYKPFGAWRIKRDEFEEYLESTRNIKLTKRTKKQNDQDGK